MDDKPTLSTQAYNQFKECILKLDKIPTPEVK